MNNSRIYRRFAVAAIALLIAGLVPSSVLAVGTVYVQQTNTIGHGGNCESPDYHDIQEAVDDVASGATIHICGGTYMFGDPVVISGKTLTLAGDTSGAILDGGGTTIIASESDLTIVDLTFQNAAGTTGGAVRAEGSVSVRGSTFVNNTATSGGGAIHAAAVAISNSTFKGNSSTAAGGAVAATTGTIVNVTFVGNTSGAGGTAVAAVTSMTVTNSILADATSNCGGVGTFTDGGGNLSTDTSCTGFAGNSTSLSSLGLGALANNGGPTQTVALNQNLGANSVAINHGVDAACADSPVSGLDQRGRARPSGTHCDSGAFEAQLGSIVISPTNAQTTAGVSKSYTAEGFDSNGNDLGDFTSTTDFSIDSSPCTGASCASNVMGDHTVTAADHSAPSIHVSTNLHVNHATLVSLAITPTDQTIVAGDHESYAATGTDTYSNHWDATSDSTFSISPISGSSCTSGPSPTCTSTVAIDHTVTATDDTIQAWTTLHVIHTTLVLLTISPANQTIDAGGVSQAYTATGYDDPGNYWDATGSSTFSITGAGSSCTGASCTSTVPGDHSVAATIGSVSSAPANLHVNVGTLHHLVLNPSTATIAAGGSQSYTAAGYDAYGNALGDVTGSTTFTIGGASSSCTGTSCTSTLSGDHIVTGTYGAATGTATLHVSVGAATHLSVAGLTTPRAVDASGSVTVTALDAHGNTATGYAGTVHFTSSDANATLPADGTLSSGVGTFSIALGTAGTQSVTATDTVTASINGSQIGIVVQTASPATYHAITPSRILDTRDGVPLTSRVARSFTVVGTAASSTLPGGIPASATAVTGNLTVTQQSAGGFLYLGPIPVNNPSSSTLNFPVGDDRANAATVALSSSGTLSVTYAAAAGAPTAHAIFDVTGYFTPGNSGATYHPLTPARILDSRYGTGGISAKLSSRVAKSFQVTSRGGVPDGATAVTGNLTVTQQSGGGFLYLGPIPRNNPTSSTLNFPVGDDRANAVTVALGAGGSLSVTYASSVAGAGAHVIFDVTGYFTQDMTGSSFVAIRPARILDTRNGIGGSGGFLQNRSARQFPVVGSGGVPAGAVAVTGNLTVTQQTNGGFMFLGNAATNNPTSSTLNFPVGDDRANAVTLALGGGYLYVTYAAGNGSTAHAIFDVTGYFIIP